MGKAKNRAIIILILVSLLVIIIGRVNADNTKNYLAEVIQDGSSNVNGDEQTEITKKIIEDNSSNLVYEVKLNNKLQVSTSKEVTMLVDTSKSTGINDPEEAVKVKAVSLAEELCDKVPGIQISIADNNGIKLTRSTDKQTIIDTLNNLTVEDGDTVNESIVRAATTFTSGDNAKCLIVFTDATDTMEEIQNLQNNGIFVVSVLDNMTRQSFEENGISTIGTTYMIDSIDTENIINSLNKSLTNFVVTDEFTDEIINNFEFSIIEKGENDVVTSTSTGYKWEIADIKATENATLKFKLTLKDSSQIDSNDTYKNINTSKNMKVEYNESGTTKNYDVAESPIVLICEKYSVTIQAVSEENTNLPVEGINVKVIATTESGKVVYNDTVQTDSEGKVIIDNLKTLGKLTFTATPEVNKTGYQASEPITFETYNEETGKMLNVTTDGINSTIDNNKRDILVKLPISTQKFSLEVNLTEENNTGVKIGNVEFRLIQPKVNNKYELSALYETTASNGKAIFTPSVMPKAGTYEYILSQTSEATNYESMGNVTLRITFDDSGKVTSIEKKYNDKVQATRVNDAYAVVNVVNVNKTTNNFEFEIEVTDKLNQRGKINGATYNIEVTTQDGDTITYDNQVTDENGKINLTLSGSGYIQIKVTEVSPKVGYYQDNVVKEMIIYRNDGKLQYIARTVPTDLNVDINQTSNKVKLNLTSEMNANPSAIQVQIADMQENDIFIPGISVKLIGTMTNEEYTGITDEEGKITFLVQPQDEGIYQYKIELDNSTIPNNYSVTTEDILLSVNYGEDREIVDASDIKGPFFDCKAIEYTEEDFTYHAAYAGIGLELNEEESYNFKLNLTDSETGAPLQGATYNITIEDGTNVRKIAGRATDSDGMLTTRIIATDNLTIKVQQVKSKIGYVVDATEETIKLQKKNDKYEIVSQTPYDYSDNKNGTIVSDRDIIYYHTNDKKDNDNVLLNLYINKMDKNDNNLVNIPVKVSSDTLKNSNGQLLNEQLETDARGYIELEKIKVTNIEIPKDSEHMLYIVETDGEGNEIESTKIKIKLTFRYNENKLIVELTNAESTWGNRLIKNKTFNGYETDTAYESNLYLDIYGNYDDVGNFSLDLRKLNKEGTILNGAKYDVVITRTDGTKIIKRDLEITDKVEFEGILVSKGTTIEITETEAPFGYKINEYTETLKIDEVSEDGTVSVDLQDAGYTESRASIKDIQTISLDDGTNKTFVTLDLIDQNLNTFKFGITTKDKESLTGVSGFKYYLYTNKGIQVETNETNGDGKVTTLAGASYAGQTVTYTIKETQTAKYYKGLKDTITLNIVYAEDGTVDAERTLEAQTDENYENTWNIIDTNVANGNDINIEIYNEPQEKLKVELQTVDKITGTEINNIEYQIQPSINLEGKGTTDIDIGYVAPSSLQIYTLKQLTQLKNYKTIDTQTFRLLYDENGDIKECSNLSSNLEFVNKEGKTIKLKVYIEPKTPITITSLGYFDNTPLENAEYTIRQNTDTTTGKTNSNGVAEIYNGILGQDSEITYTITENKIAQGYVKIDSFKIKVHYNSNREIDNVSLVGEANRWISVSYKTPSESTDTGYNGNDKGIVQITLKHYPEFLINITNKDRLDNSINLAGTQYSVTSSINTSDNNVLTDSNGKGVAELGKTVIEDKIVYTINETRAASLYQTIEKTVRVEVTFDENGYAKETKILDGEDFASASIIENITNPRDHFAINVEIQNCKMLKFNITAQDSQDNTYLLRGLTFTAKSELNGEQLSTSSMQTDVNGQGTLGMDKDYANQTIQYTIKETKKVSGYQFPSEDLIIEVTFDSQGKIIKDSVKMLQGAGYTEITNIDVDQFNIDLKIINEETEDFGVNITAVDKYDDSIKITDVNYEVYMMTQDYAKDDEYTGNTTTDSNGEGYVQFGKYVSSNPNGNETRSIRIKESNLSNQYRQIRAEIVVNVTFDANGLIKNVSVPGGYNTYIGWVADTRFVTVTNTRHTVSVTIKHYPYLFMNVKAVDMYTGDALSGKYKISTTKGPGYSYVDASKIPMQNKIAKVQSDIYEKENRGATLEDLVNALSRDTSIDRIDMAADGQSATFTVGTTVYTVNSILEVTKAQAPGNYSGTTGYTNIDYIGKGVGEILTQSYTTTDDGNWAKAGIGPTETDGAERTFYIYEEQAPSSPMQYQQYRPRKLSTDYSKIIASITVKYDNKGRIEKYTIDEKSYNNIKEFLDVQILDGTNLGITIKYAPITTMNVTAIDNVSKQGLSNIKISPYGGQDYGTRTAYENSTNGYYTTDTQGKTNYKYWGANVSKGENEYVINTSLNGYKGYFETGSIRIKVAYDENGRISAATVMSKDENNLPNAEIESFENNNLKIKILYNRKFNLKIDKQDEYDENTKLTARFDIQTSEEKTSITSGNVTTVGMIKPGESVEYSLSETLVPQGYIPLENLKFTVTYNQNGTIKNVNSDNPLFEVISKRTDVDTVRPTTVEDLSIKIKNEPRFAIKLNVMDKFYNEKKLSDVTFDITSDKGDTASGNAITDQNGSLTAYIAKPYKNETIKYTIKQTSTPNGYYENTTPIVVEVTFNEQGKIKEYTVTSGKEVTKIDATKFQNERYLELDVLENMPKDINIGIINYDKITNNGISGITFKVSSQEIAGGSAIKENSITTNEDGTITYGIDNFKETGTTQRIVNYTISQINKPDSYRKIQDVTIQIIYNEDGSILSRNILSNPSNINVEVALGGRLKYVGNTPVQILLKISNDNSYDIHIKNGDRNYTDLGISGTEYDVSINGAQTTVTTGEDGIADILNRQEAGTITINIAERTPGIGYKADNNNNTTLTIEKGETEYSLNLISNSNQQYADVTVSEEYGTIDITFKNETSSSLTLVKDVKEVRYNITSKESDGNGNYTNEKTIGTDVAETEAQENLHYDLGVTPQNKTIVYIFEQVDYPGDYYRIGTFEVTVEYDMYGNIKRISDNSDRVDVIENPENSHDIVAIVSEYKPEDTKPDDDKYKDQSSITVIKDNKEVKYEIGYKEIDESGTESNAKIIVDESTEVTSKEQIYYELEKLPADKTIVYTIREKYKPEDYTTNGIIEITARLNSEGVIYEVESNSDNAKAKLIPTGSNDIVVIIGEEYGSITLEKANENVKYTITSKEENSDGTTESENTIFEENEADSARRKIYVPLRQSVANKTIKYTFKETSIPEEYDRRDTFSVKVEYDENGNIKNITNDNYFLKTEVKPEGSADLYATVMTDEKINATRNPYTIKIISQEIDTNLRINDSTFNVDITQNEGDIISKLENAKTSDVSKQGYILEKGVIKIENIKNNGEIDINIDQTEAAEGYKFGDQITSGTVKVQVNYLSSTNGELEEPDINILENAGFETSIDKTNKVITIKVNNESETNMQITNMLKTKDEDGNTVKTPLEGSKFTITSKIQTKSDITETDLNVTTKMTDENGYTETKAGRPYAGKTVLYTIHQEEREDCTTIEDIILLVQYNTKGNIKYYEIISNPDDAEVTGEIGTRNIQLTVTNTIGTNKHGYKIVLEKHHINDSEYGDLIPGAKFKIEVEQEYGEYNTTWEAITDSNGKITSDLFNGYGNIKIKVTELDAPEGFQTAKEAMETRIIRNQNTGKLTIVSSDINYNFSDDYSTIYLRPVNEPQDNLYTIIANKVDKKTGKQITDSQAQFDVKMIGQENVGTEEEPDMEDVETYVGKYGTDNKGKAKIENLQKPEKPGVYKYEITETQAPDGYVKLEEPVILQVEFEEDENGKIVMKDNPIILSGDASIKSKKDDLLNITINNLNEKDLNKYTLDITKKDAETGEPIEDMALFKVWLPDSDNTALYAETMNNDYGKGKLDYCYIEQDKDYNTRLTSMQVPTEEGTLKYTFREAVAPDGYSRIEEDLELEIVFKKEESTGKMYIDQINSSNEDYLKINTPTPCNTDTVISIDILNNKDAGEQYTIHYDANDNEEGTQVPDDQVKDKDIDIILSTEEPVREGYKFMGWTTVADSKTVQYKPGDAYKANSDVTLYAVWEQPLYIKSNQYVISNEDNYVDDAKLEENVYDVSDKYILGILPKLTIEDDSKENEYTKGTKLEDFKNNIDTNADNIRIYDEDENDITDRITYLGTGMIVEFQKENETPIRLTIIAKGDLNGDGILNLSDITKAKRYIKKDELSILDTVIKKLAFDVNMDGELNMRDANNMQRAQSNDDIRRLNN